MPIKIGDLVICKHTDDIGLVVDVTTYYSVTMYHSRFSYKVIWTNEEANIDPHFYADEDDVRLYEGG